VVAVMAKTADGDGSSGDGGVAKTTTTTAAAATAMVGGHIQQSAKMTAN
jgi:hypothetical protein